MLSNIKVIFSVKDAWQNGSYEIKDNDIVTIYRTAKNGRNRDGFLLDKYENIISYCDVCDLLIFISIFSKQYFESANLCYKKYYKKQSLLWKTLKASAPKKLGSSC